MTFHAMCRRGHMLFCVFVVSFVLACPVIAEVATGVAHPLRVFVSIEPQAYFVERVGGDHVQVDVLVGPGQSPATYEPTPRQLTGLAQADFLFAIGVPFEKILFQKIRQTHGKLRIVETQKSVPLREMGFHHSHGEEEGRHGHHKITEEHRDPHIWLSPLLVKIQVDNIREALCRFDPDHCLQYKDNAKRFQEDLDALHSRLTRILSPYKGRELFVYHPAFGYFADTYGLHQVAVETYGKEPTARQLTVLIDRAKTEGVRVIFVQKQFSSGSAKALAGAIGGVVVPLDPLAKNVLVGLEEIAIKLDAAWSEHE